MSLAADLLTPSARADPYPVYRAMHEHGEVLPVPGGAVVCGYQAATAALRDRRLLVEDADLLDRIGLPWRLHPSRVLLADSMLCTNGSTHDRLRAMAGRAFHARHVDRLRPLVEHRVRRMLDDLHGTVDFVAEFAFGLPVHVIGELLGVPEADRAALRGPVADLALALEPSWSTADLTAADDAAWQLTDYFGRLVSGHRPGDDLLTTMIAAGGAHDELVANAVLLLLAGFETTIGLLGNGLALLFTRPDLLAELPARPDRVPAFVEEVLRYDPPVQLTARRASTNLRIGDVEVARGELLVVALGAANRDPARFTDPDRFDPGRAKGPPLSFGSGVHHCLGARLARLEAEVAFPLLLGRFPEIAPAGSPSRLDRFNLRAYATLPVSLGAR